MKFDKIAIWGDSVGKSVMYDELMGRYTICRDNFETALKQAGIAVKNFARMGCTASDGQALMTEEKLTGGLAVIEFGGNDSDIDWHAVNDDPEGALKPAKVSIPDFKNALKVMIQRARSHDMLPVLVTPVPVNAPRYLNWVSRGLDKSRILKYLGSAEYIYRWQERYAIAVLETAVATSAGIFDARSLFLDRRDLDDMMSIDGIHPSKAGYALIRDAVLNRLSN